MVEVVSKLLLHYNKPAAYEEAMMGSSTVFPSGVILQREGLLYEMFLI
jgi:hypothetical protein